jgi:hypothetical protein
MSQVLRRGAKGRVVAELQQKLTDFGFDPGPVDGDFGRRTQAAVKAFQQTAGLRVDGIVGEHTAHAMQWGDLLVAVREGAATVAEWVDDWWGGDDTDDADDGRHASATGDGSASAEQPAWAPPGEGSVTIVGSDGNVEGYGNAHLVDRSGETDWLPDLFQELLEHRGEVFSGLGVVNPLFGALAQADRTMEMAALAYVVKRMDAAKSIAADVAWTIAFGVSVDVGAMLGLNFGMGVYVGPSGEMGKYISFGPDIGVIGFSITSGLTAVRGGPENLSGMCYAVEVTAGEFFVGGGSLLYRADGSSLGYAMEAGVGVGAPIGAYGKITHTWLSSSR